MHDLTSHRNYASTPGLPSGDLVCRARLGTELDGFPSLAIGTMLPMMLGVAHAQQRGAETLV
jgi:hypothetical protein